MYDKALFASKLYSTNYVHFIKDVLAVDFFFFCTVAFFSDINFGTLLSAFNIDREDHF